MKDLEEKIELAQVKQTFHLAQEISIIEDLNFDKLVESYSYDNYKKTWFYDFDYNFYFFTYKI